MSSAATGDNEPLRASHDSRAACAPPSGSPSMWRCRRSAHPAATWSATRAGERLGPPVAYHAGPAVRSRQAIGDPPAYGRTSAAVRYDGSGRELLAEADVLALVPPYWRRLCGPAASTFRMPDEGRPQVRGRGVVRPATRSPRAATIDTCARAPAARGRRPCRRPGLCPGCRHDPRPHIVRVTPASETTG